MTAGWNFERRRDTCARFLIGVALLAKGRAEFDTSLEAVRSVMRLPPEDALFAARRLGADGMIAFEPNGAVRSNARGLERAEVLLADARASALDHAAVARTLAEEGIALDVLRAAIRADGGWLPCGAPASDADGAYRLSLAGDAIVLERRRDDGTYEPAPRALPA
jgi:hypothetical protein